MHKNISIHNPCLTLEEETPGRIRVNFSLFIYFLWSLGAAIVKEPPFPVKHQKSINIAIKKDLAQISVVATFIAVN